ncbi:GTP-binding protein [Paractinoplanes ferrugineus]|uniref:GTPase n=1 Tax=Paractinoplanes ferrugineus TaxID=113564 RepID=A0A919J311_9ACTN|nr:GTPase domain-containing protein [Actinoplanes ferrugineus]GIE13025.1 GTPase [Actinoplanes ferrugineus]
MDDSQLTRLLRDALGDEPALNIMIVGKTGAGKSTLLNTLFGREVAAVGTGKPVTKTITGYQLPGSSVTIYDTPGLELGRDRVSVEAEFRMFARRLQGGDPNERLHFVLYCVRAGDDRFEQFEQTLVATLATIAPTFLALTQCPHPGDERVRTFAGFLKDLELPVVSGVPFLTLARPMTFGPVELPPFGLDDLVERIAAVLPAAARKTLVTHQRISLEIKVAEAGKVVAAGAAAAAGAAMTEFDPQGRLVLAAQLGMLARLTAVFGLTAERDPWAESGMWLKSLLRFGLDYLARPHLLLVRVLPVVGRRFRGAEAQKQTERLGESYASACADIVRRRHSGESVRDDEVSRLLRRAIQAGTPVMT